MTTPQVTPLPPVAPPPDLTLIRFLGKGKSGYSYLGLLDQKQVVFKAMHSEAVSYYRFAEEKTVLEENSYAVLLRTGIPVPRLIRCNHHQHYLIKEYIAGEAVPELLLRQAADTRWLIALLHWEKRVKTSGINIDWFPANFVVCRGQLWYVDYEHNPWSDEYNFRNWGIWYWLNREGFNTFTLSGDASAINHPGTGKPLAPAHLIGHRNQILDAFDAPTPSEHS